MGIEACFPGGLRLLPSGFTARELSLRGVGGVPCGAWVGAQHKALGRWLHMAGGFLPRPGRRRRQARALDEAVVEVAGARDCLWSAVDPGNGETVASHPSLHRSVVHMPVPGQGLGEMP